MLTGHQTEAAKMHAENSAAIDQLRASIARVHSRIDGIVWKLLGWQTGLIVLGLSVLGWLLINGTPWDHLQQHLQQHLPSER